MGPTKDIIKETNIVYSWHDFVSKSKHLCDCCGHYIFCFFFDIVIYQNATAADNHNALTVVSVWAPVVAVSTFPLIFYFPPPSSNMLIITEGYFIPFNLSYSMRKSV